MSARIAFVLLLVPAACGAGGLWLTATAQEEPPAAPDERAARGPPSDDPIEGTELTPEVVAAAERGLAWLAAAQKADGSYGRTGGYSSHAGFTALAGLAFLSNGSVPGRGKYCKNVERCLNYLLAHTGRSGLIVGGGVETGPMYGHGFATLFLAEVYGQSPRDDVREKLTRAVNLIVATQNDQGGWRYQPIKMDADLSVTICQIMALRAARNNGIKVPKSTIDKAIDYVKKSQNADGGFSYVLGFGQDSAFPRSAAGVCSLFNCGIYAGPEIDRGLKYIMKFKPGRKQAAQEFVGHYFYGNYYAAQATFIAGGDYWRQWWPAISGELLAKQTRDGSWAGEAGAEYATAMACIILQIPNRYLPILQR